MIRDSGGGLVPPGLASLCMGTGAAEGAVPNLSHGTLFAD